VFEKNDRDTLSLFDNDSAEYTRRSAITGFISGRAREVHGPKISSEDIFYYVYGILHSCEYRKRFSADLTKALPRIPFDLSTQDFKSFVKAGRKLADLHLNYETGPLCQQLIITGDDDPSKLKVTKMRFPSKENKGTILFNESVKIENIPMVAYDYVVNGKSAVEWIMERYAVTKNSDSGIVNDPNLWSDNPRYILDLVSRIIQMSVETQKIVVGLPKLNFSPQRS
jgi:predicted helicase